MRKIARRISGYDTIPTTRAKPMPIVPGNNPFAAYTTIPMIRLAKNGDTVFFKKCTGRRVFAIKSTMIKLQESRTSVMG